jgi:hypothetical protein
MSITYHGSVENAEVMRVGLGLTCIVPVNSKEVQEWIANGGEIIPITVQPVQPEDE